MHALNPSFELFDIAHVPAGDWNGERRQGSKLSELGDVPRTARKYKNSGNEAKKYLKTKEVTIAIVANYARFAHKLAAI